jgi:hypothetical protein
MALDPEERKIAALFAAFEDINARVDGAVGRLERAFGNLEPGVRQTIRDAMTKELVGLQDQVRTTTAALERLRKAADWRQLLFGTGLSALVVVVTLGGLWLFTPSPAEMSRLRSERQELQGAVDLLASRGPRALRRRDQRSNSGPSRSSPRCRCFACSSFWSCFLSRSSSFVRSRDSSLRMPRSCSSWPRVLPLDPGLRLERQALIALL